MTKLVAIHQPNFFPWLGYFDKVRRADVFVVMDNTQFSKTGGTWSNRVRLAVSGEARWVTMPIVRGYHGVRTYRDTRINDAHPWRQKMRQTLRTNYGRAPHFPAVFAVVETLLDQPTDNLTDFNVTCIRRIMQELGLNATDVQCGTSLDAGGTGTDLLISMVRAVGGAAYLCGGGAGEYQADHAFADAGIELVYQHFTHPEYAQCNTAAFLPGLSILDALMNCGWAGTAALLGDSAPA